MWDYSIGLIGPRRERLGHRGVEMIGDPGATGFFGIGMQIVFREAILALESGEGSSAFPNNNHILARFCCAVIAALAIPRFSVVFLIIRNKDGTFHPIYVFHRRTRLIVQMLRAMPGAL